MLPDLGKYATEVIAAYAVSLALLGALMVFTLVRGRRARAALAAIERETQGQAGDTSHG